MKSDRQSEQAAGAGFVRRTGCAGGRAGRRSGSGVARHGGLARARRGRGGAARRPGLHPSRLRSVTTLGGDVRIPNRGLRPSTCRGGCGRPSQSSGSGYIVSIVTRSVWSSLSALFLLLLVSLFLSLAIEPGVNRLAARGWRRGTATAVILVGVFLGFIVFVAAIGTLVGQQIADAARRLGEVRQPHGELPQQQVRHAHQRLAGDRLDQRRERRGAEVHPQPAGQGRRPVGDGARRAGEGPVGAAVHLLPGGRRAEVAPRRSAAGCAPIVSDECSAGWELAIDKTGGYLYSRALLAGLSAFFHWVLFQAIGIQAPVQWRCGSA